MTLQKPKSLQDWPNTPVRKGKKQIEKEPYVITGTIWRKMKEEKNKQKEEIEKKKEERKRKLAEKKENLNNTAVRKNKKVNILSNVLIPKNINKPTHVRKIFHEAENESAKTPPTDSSQEDFVNNIRVESGLCYIYIYVLVIVRLNIKASNVLTVKELTIRTV